jgi:Arc/MetJ-type ribon-helix-helix transcriptional regulator
VSTQIAVRLPDELVEFLDAEVSAAHAASRAALVARALERERRRVTASREIEILAARKNQPDDLDDLARYASRLPLDLDD